MAGSEIVYVVCTLPAAETEIRPFWNCCEHAPPEHDCSLVGHPSGPATPPKLPCASRIAPLSVNVPDALVSTRPYWNATCMPPPFGEDAGTGTESVTG